MKIEVTAADIAAANEWAAKRDVDIAREGLNWRGHLTEEGSITKNCPVARAARRVFSDRFVCVGTDLELRDARLHLELEVLERVYAWDDYRNMEPFSFEVDMSTSATSG